jgi:hypothetical protein
VRARFTVALLTLALAAGCAADSPRLLVDLVTDYVPGRHFFTVRTEVSRASEGTDAPAFATAERLVRDGETTFVGGVRVAELDGLPSGPAILRLTLLADDSRSVAERMAIVSLEGDTGATVLITRDCAAVVCEPDGGEISACEGGRCVPGACLPETPDACEPDPTMSPECVEPADCVSDLACGRTACVAGICLSSADDALCGETEVCDDRTGCVPAPACGNMVCEPGESDCDCPTDCAGGCGSGCCTGEEGEPPPDELPEDIPEEPPPPDPPPGVPPGPGECVVVCCDGFTEITTQPDASACRDAYANCRPHGRVETMHFEGFQIYQRPATRRCVYCCALCGNRLRYHRVIEVVRHCGVAARDYCDTGTRGGLDDADWRNCAL